MYITPMPGGREGVEVAEGVGVGVGVNVAVAVGVGVNVAVAVAVGVNVAVAVAVAVAVGVEVAVAEGEGDGVGVWRLCRLVQSEGTLFSAVIVEPHPQSDAMAMIQHNFVIWSARL